MKLRKLCPKDAKMMLEWMHDDTTVRYFRERFAEKTLDDCMAFIDAAQDEVHSIHLAIVDDQNEYMGTVSLKNIQDDTAEFAIVLRECARGKGYASFAVKEILEYGYNSRGIESVYWSVDPANLRAVRFYEKHHCPRWKVLEHVQGYTDEEKAKYKWYRIERQS